MDFEEFVTLLGPKLTAAGLPDKFSGTDFDSVFWKVLIIKHYFLLLKGDKDIINLVNFKAIKHLGSLKE